MSARHELPPGASLRVTASSGDVTVIAEERADIEAPEAAHVKTRGAAADAAEEAPRRRRGRKKALRVLRWLVSGGPHGRLREQGPQGPTVEVRSPRGGSLDLEVRCPAGTPVSVGTISGDIRLVGEFGPATVTTTSGDVSVGRAAALDARSLSGDLEVESCAGLCRMHTKSGHIRAETTGPAEAHTVSGRVRLASTAGGVSVRTISGNVELGTDGTEPVAIRTVSGRVEIRVPEERLPKAKLRSLSGKVNCVCPQGSDFPLMVTSVSGGIEVRPR